MNNQSSTDRRNDWLSPLRLTLLAINAVCFGGCLTLLALGKADGPLLLLTVAVGMMFLAALAGAIVASRRANARKGGNTR